MGQNVWKCKKIGKTKEISCTNLCILADKHSGSHWRGQCKWPHAGTGLHSRWCSGRNSGPSTRPCTCSGSRPPGLCTLWRLCRDWSNTRLHLGNNTKVTITLHNFRRQNAKVELEHLPNWHMLPSQAVRHSQLKPFTRFAHIPPFWHGDEAHSSISASNEWDFRWRFWCVVI